MTSISLSPFVPFTGETIIAPPITIDTGSGGYWTWLNQNTAVADVNEGISITSRVATALAGDSLHTLYHAGPGVPFTIIAKLNAQLIETTFNMAAISLGDNAGKIVTFEIASGSAVGTASPDPWNLKVEHWTNSTTFNSAPLGVFKVNERFKWFKIVDDGVNLSYFASADNGWHWRQVYQQPRLTFLAAITRIGFTTNLNISVGNGFKAVAHLESWNVTTP